MLLKVTNIVSSRSQRSKYGEVTLQSCAAYFRITSMSMEVLASYKKTLLRDKTGLGMYNPQNVEKSGFGQSVCVCVCLLTVCLAVAFPASSHGRQG